MDRTDAHAGGEQPVDPLDCPSPAARHSPRGVVDAGARPVDRDVSRDTRECTKPRRNLVVHEPAVRVERYPNARCGQHFDCLDRDLPAQQGLAAGDNRLDDPQLERLAHDCAPLLVAHLRGSLQRAPR